MIRVQWAPFLALLAEGNIVPSECWLDLRTGAIDELFEGDPKDGRVRLLADAAGPSAAIGLGQLTDRDHLVIYARYPSAVRCALEATYFALRELTPVEDRQRVRRERREAHWAALAQAPGARQTLEAWADWQWKHDLTEWAARLDLEPPPFAEEARRWAQAVTEEHRSYPGQLLTRFEQWLRVNAPPLARGLRPGASVELLAWADASLPRPLPSEVRLLFAWHDGSEGGLFFNSDLLSLADAVRDRALFLEVSRREGWAPARWRESWLPLFARANSDRPLVLDLETGWIFERENQHGSEPEPVYRDLVSWLETYVGALELGVFSFRDEEWDLSGDRWERWKRHEIVRLAADRASMRRARE
jgi:hypothetical protein